MKQLTTYEQFQDLLTNQSDWILFKHSPTCSISGTAYKEVEKSIDELNLNNIYQLDVLHTEDLKYKIADDLMIKHESPQIIVFQNTKVKAHANHRSVTQAWITDTLAL